MKAVEKATQRLNATQNSAATPEKIIVERQQQERIISNDNRPNFIFVKDGTKLVKIKLNEILYIEGLKDYVSIFTKERDSSQRDVAPKKIVTLQTLKSLENLLPENHFIRIHNSYIVAF